MNVIIIAPHLDDETLGCDDTILRHKNDNVNCVFVTNVSEKYGFSSAQVEAQQKQIDSVSCAYNFDHVFQLKYPTTYMDTIPVTEIVSGMSEIFRQIRPEVVYLPNRSDVHSDHRVIFDAAFACTKVFRFPSVKKILMYETVSETEFTPAIANMAFVPNYYVDITEYFEQKISIVKMYDAELGKFPFPRSIKNIEALAIFRGVGGGCQYAEAFQLLKWIT
ncbi:MAG: PIG-L family deacetylase [Holosporaceae bacterium]|jgi:LmbE family N-acetylglucosaminyl deacetylase|nr:PIG-L family deacetylase [Holosporaceae bacterium]